MKETKKISKILSGVAMTAMAASPMAAMAANTSTLDNPAGGAPILVEHPQTQEQHAGTNTTYGNGAKQDVNSAMENIAMGKDSHIGVHAGANDASFDTAIGHEAGVTGSAGTAVGAAAKVDALFGGTAIGTASNAKGGQMGTAVGHMADAEGNFTTAMGANATAKGANAEAIGANATANGAGATAIGTGANATAANSVALGKGSVADEANSVSVGKKGETRKITNVTAGVNGTDAVNVDQLKAGLDKKANVDLNNITEAGKQVIRDLSAGAAVDIKSTSGAITVKKDVKNGKSTYDLNLAENQKFNKVEVNEMDGKTVKAGDLNVTGNTVIGTNKNNTMTVNATTNLKGDVTVDGKTTFNGDVSFNQGVAFNGNVDAKSFSVNGEKYITEWGLDAHNHKIVNVADGTVAAGSKDAINGGQLYTAMNDVRKGVKDDIDHATGEVGAQAAAMAGLHPLEYDRNHKVSVAASVGAYKSETAGAIGGFYRPDDMSMVSFQTALGKNDNMYALGYSQKFGHSDEKLSDMSDVQNAMDKLKAENDDLKNKYDQILEMLSQKTPLPMRVVSEVVVAEKAQPNTMSDKVQSILAYGDDTAEGEGVEVTE